MDFGLILAKIIATFLYLSLIIIVWSVFGFLVFTGVPALAQIDAFPIWAWVPVAALIVMLFMGVLYITAYLTVTQAEFLFGKAIKWLQ